MATVPGPVPPRPVTAVPRLPYAYPPRKARITLGVMRTLLVLLFVAGVFLFATNRFQLFWVFETGDTPASAWGAAIVFWLVTAGLLTFDGRSVRASAAGIVVHRALTRTDVPWSAVTSFSHTIKCLVIETTDGGRRELQLVADEAAASFAWSTTPTRQLAEDLELLRRTGGVDTSRPAQVVERTALPSRGDVVVLAFVGIVMLAIAAARTTGAIG